MTLTEELLEEILKSNDIQPLIEEVENLDERIKLKFLLDLIDKCSLPDKTSLPDGEGVFYYDFKPIRENSNVRKLLRNDKESLLFLKDINNKLRNLINHKKYRKGLTTLLLDEYCKDRSLSHKERLERLDELSNTLEPKYN